MKNQPQSEVDNSSNYDYLSKSERIQNNRLLDSNINSEYNEPEVQPSIESLRERQRKYRVEIVLGLKT